MATHHRNAKEQDPFAKPCFDACSLKANRVALWLRLVDHPKRGKGPSRKSGFSRQLLYRLANRLRDCTRAVCVETEDRFLTSEAFVPLLEPPLLLHDFRQRCLTRSRTDNYHNCLAAAAITTGRLRRAGQAAVAAAELCPRTEPYIWPCSVFPLIFWNISDCDSKTR